MPDPTEHHRDKRVVVCPIPNIYSYAYIAACIQGEIVVKWYVLASAEDREKWLNCLVYNFVLLGAAKAP